MKKFLFFILILIKIVFFTGYSYTKNIKIIRTENMVIFPNPCEICLNLDEATEIAGFNFPVKLPNYYEIKASKELFAKSEAEAKDRYEYLKKLASME